VTSFFLRHSYLLLFAATLGEQLGLPLPSAPLLLAAGALARSGQLTLGLALLLPVCASLIAHQVWFEAGRRYGTKVLRLICRISLEPDSCVRRTEGTFTRYGQGSVLAGPFVPGLSTVVPPLAGMSGMSRGRFLLLDGAGATLWASVFVSLGWLFGAQLAELFEPAVRMGAPFVAAAALAFGAWLGFKIYQRQSLLRDLRVARISPLDLKARLDAGESALIVDLRHSLELLSDPRTLPGALVVAADELAQRWQEIPRDREIILYCS